MTISEHGQSGSQGSVTQAGQFLGHAETFLKRGNDNLKLRYLFLFNSLGSVKKQTRKRNSHRDWHSLMPLHFQEVTIVLFLGGAMTSKK